MLKSCNESHERKGKREGLGGRRFQSGGGRAVFIFDFFNFNWLFFFILGGGEEVFLKKGAGSQKKRGRRAKKKEQNQE